MSFNATCKCGSPGYQGFSCFECSNPGCQWYVAPKKYSAGPASSPASVKEQRALGLEFLKRMCEDFPISNGGFVSVAGDSRDPYIAGGAPRDWYFGNLARDIDVFVPIFNRAAFDVAFPDATISPASKAAKKKNNSYTPLVNHQATKGGGLLLNAVSVPVQPSYGKDRFEVWDVEWRGQAFQIIDTNTASVYSHIMTFDFGINMIMTDPDGNVTETDEFKRDVANKTLTIHTKMMSLQTFKTLKERFEKMQAKFPGYRLDMA